MKPEVMLAHEFVELIPDDLKERTLYISITYCTTVHKCCCGCGRDVVTPLSPTGWQLIFDGNTVSLYPSIGSWSLPCQSHYFITKNKVVWAPKWSEKQIARGRAREARAREEYYADTQNPVNAGRSAHRVTTDKATIEGKHLTKDQQVVFVSGPNDLVQALTTRPEDAFRNPPACCTGFTPYSRKI